MLEAGPPVKDLSINPNTKITDIFDQMSKSGGFESRNLAEGLDILSTMISDKTCLKFLSFVGAVVSTDRKSTRLNSIHVALSRMPSSA